MTKRKNESTKDYIERWRKQYSGLKPLHSKLINARISFTSEGFNHLIYSGGRRRPLRVIEDRLPYVSGITNVILDNPILQPPRKEIIEVYGKKREVVFYTFLNNVRSNQGKVLTVKVVVRKIGDNGDYIFQSVMKKRIKTKKP